MTRPDPIPPTREELEALAQWALNEWSERTAVSTPEPMPPEAIRIAELLNAFPVGERVEGSAWKEMEDGGWSFGEHRPVDGDFFSVLYVGERATDEDEE